MMTVPHHCYDCHCNDELEEEYLLETSSQQEIPRGATTHLTTDQALEIEKLLQESHSWSHNGYGAHCGCR